MTKSGSAGLRTLVVGLSLTFGLALAVAGCSSETTEPSAMPSAQDGTSLTVTITNRGRVDTWSLTCDPDAGDHPSPRAACMFLDTAKQWGQNPFDPTPSDNVCAEVFGGEETATVTGVWDGKPVDASFDRTNACEISRWSNAIPLLVVQGS